MNAEFTIVWKGQSSGPFNQLEIQKKLLAGEITPLHAILRQGEPIDAIAWVSQLRSAVREEEAEARRQEEARTAENERLRFHQQENERLQRELEEAQHRAALPPPPPPLLPHTSYPSVNPYSQGPARGRHTPSNLQVTSQKSRTTYVLLGIFLGGLGIHNFYAGYTGKAITQLLIFTLLFWTAIAPLVICIWVIVEIFTIKFDSSGAEMSWSGGTRSNFLQNSGAGSFSPYQNTPPKTIPVSVPHSSKRGAFGVKSRSPHSTPTSSGFSSPLTAIAAFNAFQNMQTRQELEDVNKQLEEFKNEVSDLKEHVDSDVGGDFEF
jgi:TM2 domain-containing membrane protein YozV